MLLIALQKWTATLENKVINLLYLKEESKDWCEQSYLIEREQCVFHNGKVKLFSLAEFKVSLFRIVLLPVLEIKNSSRLYRVVARWL